MHGSNRFAKTITNNTNKQANKIQLNDLTTLDKPTANISDRSSELTAGPLVWIIDVILQFICVVPVSTIPLPFFRCRFRRCRFPTPLPLPLSLPLSIFLPFTAITERNFLT